MPRITIDIPDHLHKELKQAAKANSRSMSGEILHRLTQPAKRKPPTWSELKQASYVAF